MPVMTHMNAGPCGLTFHKLILLDVGLFWEHFEIKLNVSTPFKGASLAVCMAYFLHLRRIVNAYQGCGS